MSSLDESLPYAIEAETSLPEDEIIVRPVSRFKSVDMHRELTLLKPKFTESTQTI